MNNKVIGIAAAIALIIGIIGLFGGEQGPPGKDGNVGSFPGPDIYTDYWSINGVTQYYQNMKMTQGTTTPCAFIPTRSATTTLVRATAGFHIASTSATEIAFGKSAFETATTTNTTATTTELGVKTLAASAMGTFTLTATTSNNGQLESDLATIFAPGDAIVLSIAGGDTTGDTSPAGLKPEGYCSFLFEEIKN